MRRMFALISCIFSLDLKYYLSWLPNFCEVVVTSAIKDCWLVNVLL